EVPVPHRIGEGGRILRHGTVEEGRAHVRADHRELRAGHLEGDPIAVVRVVHERIAGLVDDHLSAHHYLRVEATERDSTPIAEPGRFPRPAPPVASGTGDRAEDRAAGVVVVPVEGPTHAVEMSRIDPQLRALPDDARPRDAEDLETLDPQTTRRVEDVDASESAVRATAP